MIPGCRPRPFSVAIERGCSGSFIKTKGIKLAKGQTLTLNGASVNLGAKVILTTAAGSTLKVSESTSLSGGLTLGGG